MRLPRTLSLSLSLALAACSSNGGSTHDGGEDGPATSCDHAITTPACWSTAPDQQIADPATAEYAGGAYDGHYIYFAPSIGVNALQQYATTGVVARYDPTVELASPAARTTFDTRTLDPNAQGYQGAVFDGHYVYFIPYFVGMPFGGVTMDNGVIARFDTTGDFTDPAAWTAFDIETLATGGEAFRGATYDGHYLYLPEFESTVLRYDTTADLTASTSWTHYDAAIGTASPDLAMDGAVFDGHYIYFVPGDTTTVLARYDTTMDFSTDGSWAVFDVRGPSPSAKGFTGGGFDGRYLYLAPSLGTPIVRYDTQGDFQTAAAWSTFDPSPLARAAGNDTSAATIGFQGVGYDGHHVYFVGDVDDPDGRPTESSGQVIAYDPTADFAAATSWSAFDTRALDPSAAGYFGAVFDGRYMYFPPASIDGAAARFDAVSPAAEPALPQFHGSFF